MRATKDEKKKVFSRPQVVAEGRCTANLSACGELVKRYNSSCGKA